MTLSDMEKEAFKARYLNKNKSVPDLDWMVDTIKDEVETREYEYLKNLEFRICDKCNKTYPEHVHYCACNPDKMMRREPVIIPPKQ